MGAIRELFEGKLRSIRVLVFTRGVEGRPNALFLNTDKIKELVQIEASEVDMFRIKTEQGEIEPTTSSDIIDMFESDGININLDVAPDWLVHGCEQHTIEAVVYLT